MKNNYSCNIELLDGKKEKLDIDKLKKLILSISKNIDNIDPKLILEDCLNNLFKEMKIRDLYEVLIISSKSLIEKDPNYSVFAAKVLIKQLLPFRFGQYVYLST